MGRHVVTAIAILLVVTACSSSSDEATSTTTSIAAALTTSTEPVGTVMHVTSPAFEDGEPIPSKHSCNGVNTSPQLNIADAPSDTAALVLIMDDPDAPGGTWDHWIAYDIAPTETIAAGDDAVGTGGVNSWGETGYGGPCPPSGTHRYFFKVFALDSDLGLGEGLEKEEVISAMESHILSEAVLMGTFAR